MSFDAGSITARLLLDRRGFDEGLDQSQKKTKTFSSQITGMLGKLGGAAAFGALAKQIITSGAELEKTRIAFQTFTGSVEEGNKVLAQLQEFANVTPFSTEEVVAAGKQMVAFGVQTDKLKDILGQLGDVAAGVNKPLQEVGLVYGQVLAKGRLQGEEMLQLQEKGIPIAEALAKVTGKSGVELQKMISAGKVSAQTFQDAFATMNAEGGKFQGLMEKQSQTMAGLASTIMGKINNALAEFGELLSVVISPAIQFAIDYFDSFGKSGAETSLAFDTLKTVLTYLTGPFGLLITAIEKVTKYTKLLSANWERLDSIMAPMREALLELEVVFDEVSDLFNDIFKSDNADDANKDLKVMEGIAKGIAVAMTLVATGLTVVLKTIKAGVLSAMDLWTILKSIAKKDWDTVSGVWDQMKERSNETASDIMADFESAGTRISDILAGSLDKAKEKTSELKKEVSKIADQGDAEKYTKTLSHRLMESGSLFESAGIAAGESFKGALERELRKKGHADDAVKSILGTMISAIEKGIAELAQKAFDTFYEIAGNKLQAAQEKFGLISDVFMNAMSAYHERELQAFEDKENRKIEIMRAASAERQALMDEELQKMLAAIDAEINQRLEMERADNARKREEIGAQAEFEAERRTNDAILRQDLLDQEEALEREREERKAAALADVNKKKTDDNKKTQDAIAEAEAAKEKKLAEIQKKQEQREKLFAKFRAFMEWQFELSAYKMEQQKARANVMMMLGQATMGAVAGGLQLPPPASFAYIGAMSALAAATSAMSLASIQSVPPPLPPAELFARDGGMVMGRSHLNGGTMIEAERGEMFLSRSETGQLMDAVKGGMGVNVYINEGAFQGVGSVDERAVDQIAEIIARKIERG